MSGIKNNPEKIDMTKNIVPVAKLKWKCPASKLKFKSTEEIEPLDKIVGQPRAINALKLGSELFSKGYNIFVSGISGTGRLTTVKKLLQKVSTHNPDLFDYCYVYNFSAPDHPRLLKLKKGEACKFRTAVEEAVTFTKRRLPKLFEDENFRRNRQKIIEDYQEKERQILNKFDKKIEPFGFIRGQIENENGTTQPEVFPIINEKPIQIEDIDQFVESGDIDINIANEKRELYRKFHNEIFDIARKGMKLMQEFRRAISKSDKKAASVEVEAAFDEIPDNFNYPEIEIFINEVKDHILDNLSVFVPSTNPFPQLSDNGKTNVEDHLHLFNVNIVLDNSSTSAAPVVIETTPSYNNLFGTIERILDSRGFWRSDFTKIKAGSILKADQGYLIVSAGDLFSEPGVWQALKRVLLYDKLDVQPLDSYFNLSQTHLKPEPIKVNVKVIIIGGQTLYRMLYLHEKGFKKIFKINAQFDYETRRTDDMIEHISRFIAKICRDDNLCPFARDGVASIVEWAIAHAGSQERITLKFSDIADIIRESAYAFKNSGDKDFITSIHVDRAIKERRFRNDLVDEKVKHHILNGNTFIDTEGSRIGQINGLTVYDTGLLSFGKPARITSTISAGNAGIVNIEREADMSGTIHNKGVLIITGLLQERFAYQHPLSLTASIAFEQSYGGIDGDSASAAEIYVLLSALTNTPIKQDLAITGSVNQKGDIQPIGGVNEKITGFFEICRDRGLTGKQGVIIPSQNVKDLMLTDDILNAAKKKKFFIYSIEKIEDGVPLLMGIEAGIRGNDGSYPKQSLFGLAERKLEEYYKLSRNIKDKNSKKKKNS